MAVMDVDDEKTGLLTAAKAQGESRRIDVCSAGHQQRSWVGGVHHSFKDVITRLGWGTRLRSILLILLIVAAYISFPLYGLYKVGDKASKDTDDGKLLDFSEIVPSEKLEWHPCFAEYGHRFKCARLTVPMDYNRPLNESKDSPKVHVALLLLPGIHSNVNGASKSPLLINPGGPGGSGTGIVLGWGSKIHKIVGEDQDVIGFDPRGIGATTPRADCWALGSSPEEVSRGFLNRVVWQLQATEVGLVNSTSDSLKKVDTRSRALAKLCEEQDSREGKDSILKYVHTPSVARDMISIIDAWDEWTETLDDKSESGEDTESLTESNDSDDSADSYSLDTKGKLVYWGFSYGTLLGATFASMFPNRVGRVILDGVVDADLYVSPIWVDSIHDTDKIIESFYTYCYRAGSKCIFYKANDTPQTISARFQTALSSLKQNPITVIDPISLSPTIIHYDAIKSLLFSSLYSPIAIFPIIAIIMDILHRRDDFTLGQIFRTPDLAPYLCSAPRPAWTYPGDAQYAIMCSDKRYPLNATLPALEGMFKNFANSSSVADVWMTLMMGCNQWGIKAVDPPMRWDDHPAHKQNPIKTSFPVLFLSNTYDPVTPLSAGLKMASKFIDAGLVEQVSEGHCTFSAVSKCTIGKIRAYFREGKVPRVPKVQEVSSALERQGLGRNRWVSGDEIERGEDNWEICKADEWPWHPFPSSSDYINQGNEGSEGSDVEAMVEIERLSAWKEMQDATLEWDFWGKRVLVDDGAIAALMQQ